MKITIITNKFERCEVDAEPIADMPGFAIHRRLGVLVADPIVEYEITHIETGTKIPNVIGQKKNAAIALAKASIKKAGGEAALAKAVERIKWEIAQHDAKAGK